MTFYDHLGGRPLQDYYRIQIETQPDKTKKVRFCSKIHIPRRTELSWTYGQQFTDSEILFDGQLIDKFHQMFGRSVYYNPPL